jgi:hypothetical protein
MGFLNVKRRHPYFSGELNYGVKAIIDSLIVIGASFMFGPISA